MCGISGIFGFKSRNISQAEDKIRLMNKLIEHRGPDDEGVWVSDDQQVALGHRRLSIIDLSSAGHQPFRGIDGNMLAFNGEIYNYIELRESLRDSWDFRTHTDTEVILAAYAKYGTDCIHHLRGMFAFAIWDHKKKQLFCARDHFGIKPFYYINDGSYFYFASEAKALLPFLPEIKTNEKALTEYFIFQYNVSDQTLFDGVKTLLPGYAMIVSTAGLKTYQYWDVEGEVDFSHDLPYFKDQLEALISDSINVHLRGDVPVSSYLSGGYDSSLVAILANENKKGLNGLFHGRFTQYPGYDESHYAKSVADLTHQQLYIEDITAQNFMDNISKVVYHLDFPIAGPGSFPQYMVSQLASKHTKVILGGQGGDEIFGGYARYLAGYLDASLAYAVTKDHEDTPLHLDFSSMLPNLGVLKEYRSLVSQLWREGLWKDSPDQRYFRLINRASDAKAEIRADILNQEYAFGLFEPMFNAHKVKGADYMFNMTNYELKCLLPSLLQVEDRMSMAHGLESRVPFLDKPLVEFLATMPTTIKCAGGQLKYILRETYNKVMPQAIVNRRDKMGFPVPLKEWIQKDLKEFLHDIMLSQSAKQRPYLNDGAIEKLLSEKPETFSRKLWGMLTLEIWQKEFHDKASYFKGLGQNI
jgi:asparagine synthase (glutamine-hydrolysing)